MKKTLSVLAVCVLVGFTVSVVMANDLSHKVGIGLNLGMEKYRGEESYNENSKFDFAREVYLKYGLSSNVSAIFNYGLQDLEYGPEGKDDDGNLTTEVDPYIEFKLQFCAFPESRITPFAFAGGGILNFNPKDADENKLYVSKNDTWGDWKGMALVGAGAEFFVTDWFAINGLIDWHLPFTDQLDALPAGDWDDGYWGGKVGLALYAGTTDTDGDGIPNRCDADPKHAEDLDCFEDEDGAPECDNDRDGVVDVADWAPNEPEDMDGYADWDGAPDPDNDGDGILDGKDQDPNNAEDFDKFEDADGIPDYDNDNDGIADVYDGAPNDPETVNGFMDWDGIPDEKPFVRIEPREEIKKPAEPQTIVVVVPERVGEKVILRGVNFETASDILTPTSHYILDEAVQILKDHPEIELEVQGHTDSRGSDSYNLDLSQRRANSVRKYLVNQGIFGSRLTSIGYGEKQPIAPNTTADGMAENRRVEFLRLK